MMAERVLANPLSGLEVRTAILDKIGRCLERDCHLSVNLAYQFFEAHVTISLKVHDIGRVETVNADVTAKDGEIPENPDEFLDQADAELDIEAQSPNEVRVETGQEVPVLTRDADGNQTIKGIRYARKHAQK
jgi:hypothetical protein